MNLIIDIGNTRAKLAVFEKNEIIDKLICLKEEIQVHKNHLLKKYPQIRNGIIASVAGSLKESEKYLNGLDGKTILLSPDTPLPFTNSYGSPKTLGLDRIALASAAVAGFPGKNVLVIDAGTCITYDLVTEKGAYLGGAISPGYNLRFRAMNNFTAHLPLLEANAEIPAPIGQNTEQSLRLGVNAGIQFEIEGFIRHFEHLHTDLTVVLTGGDRKILSECLKNTIFVAENFLTFGLNHILEFNRND